MKAQEGQLNDIKKVIPTANSSNVEIIAEGGSDNGKTFNGSFLAKVGGKTFKFEDGKLIKRMAKGSTIGSGVNSFVGELSVYDKTKKGTPNYLLVRKQVTEEQNTQIRKILQDINSIKGDLDFNVDIYYTPKGSSLSSINKKGAEKILSVLNEKYAKGYMVEFKNGSTIEDHEASWVKACMKNHSKEECFAIILKDSQFNSYIGKPKNEYTHNRLPKKAIISKDSVHLSSYTPNTGRHLDTIEFKDPTELLKYLNKHEIIAKGTTIKGVGIDYKDAISEFNSELINNPMVIKASEHYGKTPSEIVKALQIRLSTKGNRQGKTEQVWIDFEDKDSGIKIKHKKIFNNGEYAKGGNTPSDWCYSIGGL